MAAKSWQPSHEPPAGGREKAGTHHTDETVQNEGRDRGAERTFEQSP